jgi:hypothetical protein
MANLPAATPTALEALLPELLSGKTVQAVVLPSGNVGLAFAQPGDAYPRIVILLSGAASGVYVGDGKSKPVTIGGAAGGGLSAAVALTTTSAANPVTGAGSIVVNDTAAANVLLAAGLAADAFPRVVLGTDPTGRFVSLGDGTTNPVAGNAYLKRVDANTIGVNALTAAAAIVAGTVVQGNELVANNPGVNPTDVPQLQQVSPVATITSGVLPTQVFASGVGAQVSATRDVDVHVPVTFNPQSAATATCRVELSPDNVTYSTLCIYTVPVGVNLAGTIQDVTCRVPAGWRLRLTVVNAVLATATYF